MAARAEENKELIDIKKRVSSKLTLCNVSKLEIILITGRQK